MVAAHSAAPATPQPNTMTWHYTISDDGSTMTIYESDPEYTGEITTLESDGTGFTILSDIRDVMRETWEQEASLGQSPVMSVRAGHILMDLTTENIKEGPP